MPSEGGGWNKNNLNGWNKNNFSAFMRNWDGGEPAGERKDIVC